jgi:hypothetical protein
MSFIDLYTKVDAGATAEEILAPVVEPEETKVEMSSEETPF